MPRRSWLFLVLVFAMMALPVSSTPAADAVKLELKFQEGDTFYIETTNGWVHYPWEPIDSLGSVYHAALREN